jgi:hypothetical protein
MSGFPSGYFKIKNRMSGKCLSIKDGHTGSNGEVVLLACQNGNKSQLWYEQNESILSVLNSRMALDIHGANRANGAKIQTFPYHGKSNQKWFMDNQGRMTSRMHGKSISFDENGQGVVYLWENHNGPSQKWYLERVDVNGKPLSQSSELSPTTLVADYSSKDGVRSVPSGLMDPSSSYTYQFWFKLDRFHKGSWKLIFCRGQSLNQTRPRLPGLWVHPNELKFHPRVSTDRDWNDGCNNDVNYIIPLQTWINLAYIIDGTYMHFFVDGVQLMSCQMKGMVSPAGNMNLFLGPPNNDMHIKSMEYTPRVLSEVEIRSRLAKTRPVDPQPVTGHDSMGRSIKIMDYQSNGSHAHCPANRAAIGEQGWCAAEQKTGYYLEANLGRKFTIRKILTQGRGDHAQWVKEFTAEYQNNKGEWVSVDEGKRFQANNDQHTIVSQVLTNPVQTRSIRIHPVTWHGHPSMRLGLEGEPATQIHITSMVSNGSHPHCSSHQGRLGMKGWCAARKAHGYFLQANFDKKYALTKILTQGRNDSPQWVTSFDLTYMDDDGQWVTYPQTLTGNSDKDTVVINDIRVNTKSVRVYPKSWNHHPSMRIGFDGNDYQKDRCSQYLELSTTAETEEERQRNLRAYNSDCKRISYQDHLNALQKSENQYKDAYQLLSNVRVQSQKQKQELLDYQTKIKELHEEIEKTKMDLEIEKNRKCPPAPRCLEPVLTKSEREVCDINDFDIRTHGDFHKYILATDVKPCDTNEMSCKARFIQNQTGGGLYDKLCRVALGQNQNQSQNQSQNQNQNQQTLDPYDIRNHRDFKKLMQNYVAKDQCAIKPRRKISVKQCKEIIKDIEKHPQFPKVCRKKAEPSPQNFQRVQRSQSVEKKPAETCDIKKHPEFKNYVHKSEIESMIQKVEGSDITKHPQYQDLMKKYALRDPNTCPPTYKPCPPAINIKDVPINRHPDFDNYVSKNEVLKIMKQVSLMREDLDRSKLLLEKQKKLLKQAQIERTAAVMGVAQRSQDSELKRLANMCKNQFRGS